MKRVFEALAAEIRSGNSSVLVSAVGGSGSVPRKTRAHMLVTKQGRLCGTVGGGAVEGRAILLAKELLAGGQSCVRKFELHEQDAQNLGMICGGEVDLNFCYVSPLDEAMLALAERAVSLFARGERAWLMVSLETSVLSLYDGKTIIGAPVSMEILSGLSASAGRTTDGRYYAELLVSPGKVYIFGGGHVAQALVPILASVDFRCVVLEDREEFANPALFRGAEDVRLLTSDQWEAMLSVSPEDCVCIMTRGHQNDLDCQAFALKTPAYYIGVIGSRKKIAVANEKLRAMGFSDEEISRLHTPIGLPIGAQTPAEIAISIAAEMILCRAKRNG